MLELNSGLESKVMYETNKRIEQERILMQQSRLAAMGEMIGAIAHQWRQPLNALALKVQDIVTAYDFEELNKEYLLNFKKSSIMILKYLGGS